MAKGYVISQFKDKISKFNRRIFCYKDFQVAVYGSPSRDLVNGNVHYNIEYINPPLGKSTITLENFTKERIPNNLYTKELVARLAFNDLENNK